MLKKELENKIRELESQRFDMDRKLYEANEFIRIGDEKLVKAYEKVDAKLAIINQIKKLLNNK